MQKFKGRAHFVYYTDHEYPVYTATVLDDFLFAVGQGHKGKHVDTGIRKLTLVLKWRHHFGDEVLEPAGSRVEKEREDQILIVTRLLCILQYYEIRATLTFPDTSKFLGPAFY